MRAVGGTASVLTGLGYEPRRFRAESGVLNRCAHPRCNYVTLTSSVFSAAEKNSKQLEEAEDDINQWLMKTDTFLNELQTASEEEVRDMVAN